MKEAIKAGRKIDSARNSLSRTAKQRSPVKEKPAARMATAKMPTAALDTRSSSGSCDFSKVAGSMRKLAKRQSVSTLLYQTLKSATHPPRIMNHDMNASMRQYQAIASRSLETPSTGP